EIKPACTISQLVEAYRARIAETAKRQLHARIVMKSKNLIEFFTFWLFDRFNIELYMMAFDSQ
ncbi:hypothetical protein EDC94DRAFT_501206, partial [Helicostylum pulchrum]